MPSSVWNLDLHNQDLFILGYQKVFFLKKKRDSCKMNKWYCVHLSCWVKLLLTNLQNDLTKQEFLQGHNNRVSCVALSHNGKLLASGQVH